MTSRRDRRLQGGRLTAAGAERERAPVGQLGPDPWRLNPVTRAVMETLAGEGGEARFVGGCVRDALIHRPSSDGDVDIATTELPDRVMALMEARGFKVIPTGLAHGTVTVVAEGLAFEVTTLRRDTACDGRHADVEFTTSFREDAHRRDFTFNALSADGDGRVYDYFDGIADLMEGRVRFIGRPMDRIKEDYLRILRFFRFFGRFGRPPANPDALSACATLAAGVDALSAERIRAELLKILAVEDPAGVLALMRGARVLDRILPEARDLPRLRALVLLETRGLVLPRLGPDPLRRLASVLDAGEGGESPGLAVDLGERLRLSRAETERLDWMLEGDPAAWPDPDSDNREGGMRRLLDAHGPERLADRILLAWSRERALELRPQAVRTEHWRALLEQVLAWEAKPFPLTGGDLLARGFSGPDLGQALARLRGEWLDGDRLWNREEALARLDLLPRDASPSARPSRL
ncbi:MAG: CCA tRNA nucleotidyltransferase [Rhodospirillum sp.]|nr:CCA tRNA nucleotidyltransferase [Rhodospirillum sp.]MCF8488723.1 CCA tRNA nucleotidyltransferase [Rhodospirillum sp.]MCF8503159.1 CCA tRNA nucleotidyltransferase [Rhodospirillum sp.]